MRCLLILFMIPSFLGAWIASDTPVRTAHGFVMAQDLDVGHKITATSAESVQFEATIVKIIRKTIDTAVCIDIGHGIVYVSEEQKFYDTDLKYWLPALLLTPANRISDYHLNGRETFELCNLVGPFYSYKFLLDKDCCFYIGLDSIMVKGRSDEEERKESNSRQRR